MSADSTTADLERALAAGEIPCDELARELELLDADHGASGAPIASVTPLLLRGIPDLCSLLAPHLRDLSPVDVTTVLDHCFGRPPFDDERMSDQVPDLRAHLDAYAKSLLRWEGWHARTLELGEFDSPDPGVRWVTAWERREDGAVAADFVGYVKDPDDIDRPHGPYAVFARDAHAVFERLLDEYGENRVKGVRLWIVGADNRPVVRWLSPQMT